MANITVSSDVDTFMQSANLADMKSSLGIGAGVASGNGYTVRTVGDSISLNTLGGTLASPIQPPGTCGRGFLDYANRLLGGRLSILSAGGIGGQNSAQILARIPGILALSPKPQALVVMMGTNDFNASAPANASDVIANYASARDLCVSAGVSPWFFMPPPKNDFPLKAGYLLSGLIKIVTETPGALLINTRDNIIDSATGGFRDGVAGAGSFTTDGTHMTAAGYSWQGKAGYDVISKVIPPIDLLPDFEDDPSNLITVGMMLGTGGSLGASSGQLATGWTSRFGANATLSKVSRSNTSFSWQQLEYAAPGNASGDMYISIPGITSGSIFEAFMEVEMGVGSEDISEVGIVIDGVSSGTVNMQYSWHTGGDDGYIPDTPVVLRTGIFQVTSTESFYFKPSVAGTGGIIRMGRMALRQLA